MVSRKTEKLFRMNVIPFHFPFETVRLGGQEKMEAAEYFSKDFEWEELRAEVENDPSLRCHLLPFESSNPSSIKAADEDSAAWKRFHVRHSSGKFFKVPIFYFQYRLMSLKLSDRKCPGFVNVIDWVFGCRESSIQNSKKGIDVILFFAVL